MQGPRRDSGSAGAKLVSESGNILSEKVGEPPASPLLSPNPPPPLPFIRGGGSIVNKK